MTQPRLTRLSFNFTAQCNMGCRFCYIPFDRGSSELRTWQAIMSRAVELGATQVTFGGGDPFISRDFIRLVAWLRETHPDLAFIHVDTNGIGLDPRDYDVVARHVDLLGLPLEGPTPTIHAAVRRGRGHFTVVTEHLRALVGKVPIKVNTLVTQENVLHLRALAELLMPLSPAVWAMYQFWPIGPIAVANAGEFDLSADAYADATRRICDEYEFCRIEAGTTESRAGSYFLVTQNGGCYATSPGHPREYADIGSIFDGDVLRRWEQVVDVSANASRMRLRLEALGLASSGTPERFVES